MSPRWLLYLVDWTLMVSLARAQDYPPLAPLRGESFSRDGVLNYDTFLLSKDEETLYVGARDAILALDVSNSNSIQFKGEIQWSSTPSKIDECVLKGKSRETNCFNFIRVLVQLNETHLYTCGTNAFSPICAYIDVKDFVLVKDAHGEILVQKGKGVCPYDPQYPNTAIVVDDELYAGTMNDFQGNEPILSRTLGSRTALKTDNYLNWFQEAKFVSSFHASTPPHDDKVYFFFEETSKGFDLLDKLTVARVARVCKNDIGGERILQKQWTTFLKAQLSCIEPGQFPNSDIQQVAAIPHSDGGVVFYGLFHSQWKMVGHISSAICAFTLDAIKKAFDGRYRELDRVSSRWNTYYGPVADPRPGSCSVGPSAHKTLAFMKEHFLMDETVAPVNNRPFLTQPGKFTRFATHRTQDVSGSPHDVLFLGTETGFLRKSVVIRTGTLFIEEMKVFDNSEAIQNLLLSPEKGVLYVGYSKGVLQIPLADCSTHVTCADCVSARDPYCAWDGSQCRAIREGGENVKTWIQNIEKGKVDTGCE